jgi:hypothetical protein
MRGAEKAGQCELFLKTEPFPGFLLCSRWPNSDIYRDTEHPAVRRTLDAAATAEPTEG